jgi:hypothetical protein
VIDNDVPEPCGSSTVRAAEVGARHAGDIYRGAPGDCVKADGFPPHLAGGEFYVIGADVDLSRYVSAVRKVSE